MKLKSLLLLVGLVLGTTITQAQEGRLIRTDLFNIPTSKFEQASGFTFKIAADSKELIA
jgi:uncharacterized protein HemY